MIDYQGRRPLLIATDIDGTMVDGRGVLSPRVRRSLHEAVECGIHVVPATGRPHQVSADVIAALGLSGHWIFANGAVTCDLSSDSIVRSFWFDRSDVASIVTEIRQQLPEVSFLVEFANSLVYEAALSDLAHTPRGQAPISSVLLAIDRSPESIQKVLAHHPGLPAEDLLDPVAQIAGVRASVSTSGMRFVELANPLASKASALSLLAADLGLDADDVVAVGDNANDVSMLRWAGRGYAMANGSPVALAAADEVIPGVEADGLAQVVEALIAS